MKRYLSMLIVTMVMLFAIIGCNENPIEPPVIIDPPKIDSITVNDTNVSVYKITGKILNDKNFPVKGAKAFLVKSGLSALTDINGNYTISYKDTAISITRKPLAKSAINDSTDTLIVNVAIGDSSSDSIQVIKTAVDISGIDVVIPDGYIVQRDIRGSINPVSKDEVGRIEAVIYDIDFPDVKKIVSLWRDTINHEFSTFVYFACGLNKNYHIYANLYDTANHVVGRSRTVSFSGQAGNIDLKEFKWNNAKPRIFYAKDTTIKELFFFQEIDTMVMKFSVTDSIGLLSNIKIDRGNGTIENVNMNSKVNVNGIDSIMFFVILDTVASLYETKLIVTDSDSNKIVYTIPKIRKYDNMPYVNMTYFKDLLPPNVIDSIIVISSIKNARYPLDSTTTYYLFNEIKINKNDSCGLIAEFWNVNLNGMTALDCKWYLDGVFIPVIPQQHIKLIRAPSVVGIYKLSFIVETSKGNMRHDMKLTVTE